MCITVRDKNAKVSNRPVLCWKILEILETPVGGAGSIVVTPYAWEKVDQNVLRGAEDFCARDTDDSMNAAEIAEEIRTHGKASFDEGYIHTYAYRPDSTHDKEALVKEMMFIRDGGAKAGRDMYMDSMKRRELGYADSPKILGVLLCECEIPAGVEYYAGECYTHLGRAEYGHLNAWGYAEMKTYASKRIHFTGRHLLLDGLHGTESVANFENEMHSFALNITKERFENELHDFETSITAARKAEEPCA